MISKGRIKPSPSKVQKILDFEVPTSVKQLRGFLGLTGYFRKFIKNYSSIASPLYESTSIKDKNGKPIAVGKRRSEKVGLELNSKAKLAFEKLKNCLTSTMEENPESGVLLMPNFSKPFVLYTDACDDGLGAVLCQLDDNVKCRPVAFYSRKLKASEKKYAIGEKELMAIVFAMEHYKIYLYGKEFVVRSDHRPLQWLKDLKNPSTRLARWLIIARQFNFKIEFISGVQNAAADALSRFFTHGLDGEEVEEPGIVLCKIQTVLDTHVESSDENLETLRGWIVQGCRPENLSENASQELRSYFANFGKFKIIHGRVYREFKKKGDESNFQYVVYPSHRRQEGLSRVIA